MFFLIVIMHEPFDRRRPGPSYFAGRDSSRDSRGLKKKGFKFRFCLASTRTVRGKGNLRIGILLARRYITLGNSCIVDFQPSHYRVIGLARSQVQSMSYILYHYSIIITF